jgi:hypothetical protein
MLKQACRFPRAPRTENTIIFPALVRLLEHPAPPRVLLVGVGRGLRVVEPVGTAQDVAGVRGA